MEKSLDQDSLNQNPKSRDAITADLYAADLGNRTVPWGFYTKLAHQHGVSREWVRRIAQSLDFALASKVRLCKKCKVKPANFRMAYCDNCVDVSFKCDNPQCNNIVTRKIYENSKDQKYHFCSRYCLGQRAGNNYGWGRNQ